MGKATSYSVATALAMALFTSPVWGDAKPVYFSNEETEKEAGVIPPMMPKPSSSRLQIQVPSDLFVVGGGYDHREALFGRPPYGGSIAQKVYYADSDLCDPTVDPTKGYPRRAPGAAWDPPFILMTDRGGCSFVTKARNAQRAGAAGMVVADNRCLCGDTRCTQDNPQIECESKEPIMADDGSGSDISIPSFLMFKVDADMVIARLKSDAFVQMEMAWSLPNPDDRVEYQLWTVPSDINTRSFLSSWKPFAEALGERAYFTPHMFIQDGKRNGCTSGNGATCLNLCTNGGKYCATDPDFDVEHGISGADVVKESLRRICIWKEYGAGDGVGSVYWDYVSTFTELCDNRDYFANDVCIEDVYKRVKVNKDMTERCMHDSGDLNNPTISNSYLDAEIDAAVEMGVVVLPSVYVNNAVLRGALTPSEVFLGICSGFSEGTQPTICLMCSKSPDIPFCVSGTSSRDRGGSIASSRGRSISPGFFFFCMLLVCGVLGGVYYWRWKQTREDMREQVRGILADYVPLEDTSGTGPMPNQGFFNFSSKLSMPMSLS